METPKFIENNIPTIAMLSSYKKWGLLSRTFMLRENSLNLMDLYNGTGKYSEYNEEIRVFLISRIYLELFERLCQSIEDLTGIIFSLQNDLSKFQEKIISPPNPQNVLKKLTKEKWNELLRYCDIESLPLESADRDLILTVRERNITVLQKYTQLIDNFINLYWVIYNKLKHGNTLMYGFSQSEVNGERAIFIPAFYNSKEPEKVKELMVTQSIYKKWQNLFDTTITLTEDLISTNLEYLERLGKPFLIKTTYCSIDKSEYEHLLNLQKVYEKGTEKFNINVLIEAEIKEESINRHIDFYNKFDLGAFNKK